MAVAAGMLARAVAQGVPVARAGLVRAADDLGKILSRAGKRLPKPKTKAQKLQAQKDKAELARLKAETAEAKRTASAVPGRFPKAQKAQIASAGLTAAGLAALGGLPQGSKVEVTTPQGDTQILTVGKDGELKGNGRSSAKKEPKEPKTRASRQLLEKPRFTPQKITTSTKIDKKAIQAQKAVAREATKQVRLAEQGATVRQLINGVFGTLSTAVSHPAGAVAIGVPLTIAALTPAFINRATEAPPPMPNESTTTRASLERAAFQQRQSLYRQLFQSFTGAINKPLPAGPVISGAHGSVSAGQGGAGLPGGLGAVTSTPAIPPQATFGHVVPDLLRLTAPPLQLDPAALAFSRTTSFGTTRGETIDAAQASVQPRGAPLFTRGF